MFFINTKCAQFLLKIGKDLTFMIRTAKGLESMRIVFITDLNRFGSNVFLTLKIMDFENVAYSYLCDKRHECIIYMI